MSRILLCFSLFSLFSPKKEGDLRGWKWFLSLGAFWAWVGFWQPPPQKFYKAGKLLGFVWIFVCGWFCGNIKYPYKSIENMRIFEYVFLCRGYWVVDVQICIFMRVVNNHAKIISRCLIRMWLVNNLGFLCDWLIIKYFYMNHTKPLTTKNIRNVNIFSYPYKSIE